MSLGSYRVCPARRNRQASKGHDSAHRDLFQPDDGHTIPEYADDQATWALRTRTEYRQGLGVIPKDRFERLLERQHVSPDLRPYQYDEGSESRHSPFVIAIQLAGIKALPSIFNAVFLISVMSVANSCTFGSTRTIQALARGPATRL